MSKLKRLTATFSDVLRDLLPFVQSKNVKNTHGGGFNYNFTKNNTPPWVFFTFLNCTNGTKSHNAPHILFLQLRDRFQISLLILSVLSESKRIKLSEFQGVQKLIRLKSLNIRIEIWRRSFILCKGEGLIVIRGRRFSSIFLLCARGRGSFLSQTFNSLESIKPLIVGRVVSFYVNLFTFNKISISFISAVVLRNSVLIQIAV